MTSSPITRIPYTITVPYTQVQLGKGPTGPLSSHARTNLAVIDRFCPGVLTVETGAGGAVTVRATDA